MLIFNFNLMYNCSMNVFLVSSFSWVNKCFLFYSILFYTPLSHRPTRGPKFAWGRASPGPFCVGRAGGRHLRGDCVGIAWGRLGYKGSLCGEGVLRTGLRGEVSVRARLRVADMCKFCVRTKHTIFSQCIVQIRTKATKQNGIQVNQSRL